MAGGKTRKARCDKCLRGVKVCTTGISNLRRPTLKLDIGGAVLYVMPGENGTIDVSLNAENLLYGDYASCIWNGEKWIISTMSEGKNQ